MPCNITVNIFNITKNVYVKNGQKTYIFFLRLRSSLFYYLSFLFFSLPCTHLSLSQFIRIEFQQT